MRWKLLPAVFLTLAAGLLHGHVLVLRCFRCKTAHAGPWVWNDVEENANFPAGFHHPRCALQEWTNSRWFFATPQIVWESTLLSYFFNCIARGGMSLTAAAWVYNKLWISTMKNTMYTDRGSYVKKLCVAILTWSTLSLLLGSGLEISAFTWHLRPHHVSTDFADLLKLCQQAFDRTAASHICPLWNHVKAIIVDGKWCTQTRICNERGSGGTWNKTLLTGFFKGCTLRPITGAYFCAQHQADAVLAPEESQISEHREVNDGTAMKLEYLYQGLWASRDSVPAKQIRAYEMSLLRPKKTPSSESTVVCNKDSRKEVVETFYHGRKSGGILVGVAPCLHIMAVKPMWGAESLTQVLLMIVALCMVVGDLAYVLYDNACAMVRHLLKQDRVHKKKDSGAAGWSQQLKSSWVLDRLHSHYHKCWKDPSSPWHVPNVHPSTHPELKGIDTES